MKMKTKEAKAEKHPGFVTRCCSLPVGSPIGMSWAALNETLRTCFKLSTDLANWCVHALFKADDPGVKEPEAVKKWYGYGAAAKSFTGWSEWAGAMASANCVIRDVHRRYRQSRFEVMVRHDQKSLTFRYPFPLPVHNQSWSMGYAPGGFPTVKLALPGIEGRIELRLKRSAEFGRQLAMFKQLHDGKAVKGEVKLVRNRKGDLFVNMVGKFPVREPSQKRVHVCLLHTDPNALLIAEVDGHSPWILNADHVKRVIAIHRTYRQRASEDLKREKRMDPKQRGQFLKSLDARCEKNRNRMDTVVEQLSAQVSRFCERQGVARVIYDDANKEYIPDGFQWFALRERIRQKLVGIGVELISDTSTGKVA